MRAFEELLGAALQTGGTFLRKGNYNYLYADEYLLEQSFPHIGDVGVGIEEMAKQLGDDSLKFIKNQADNAVGEGKAMIQMSDERLAKTINNIDKSKLPDESKAYLRGLAEADEGFTQLVDGLAIGAGTAAATGGVAIANTIKHGVNAIKHVAQPYGEYVVKPAVKAGAQAGALVMGGAAKVGWEAGKGLTKNVLAPGAGALGKIAGHSTMQVGEAAYDSARVVWNTRNSRAVQLGVGTVGGTAMWEAGMQQGIEKGTLNAKSSNLAISNSNGGLLLRTTNQAELPSSMSEMRGMEQHSAQFSQHDATGDLVFALHNLRHGG